MINYLQLGRNIRKYAPRVEAKTTTYIYNAKGIYDFKQMNSQIAEELTNTFRDVENPVLEISVTKSSHPIGVIRVKDGEQELSQDTFVLNSNKNIDEYLPNTDGCLKKMRFDKEGIEQLVAKSELLGRFLKEAIAGLKKPNLEYWIKDRSKYDIGNIILRDGEKEIINGYFSRTKNENLPIDKFHFKDGKSYTSGYGFQSEAFIKIYECLPKKLQQRLWMLDERSKNIMKRRYGIGCSPKGANYIAKEWNITASRVREIISQCRAEMENANTFNMKLNRDLDSLGYVLSDDERYRIYRNNSILDMHNASYKIKRYNMRLQKFIQET